MVSGAMECVLCDCGSPELFNLPVLPKHPSKYKERVFNSFGHVFIFCTLSLVLSSRRCLWFACQSLVGLARSHTQAGAS